MRSSLMAKRSCSAWALCSGWARFSGCGACTMPSALRAIPLARSSMKLPGCETSASSPSAWHRRSSAAKLAMLFSLSAGSGDAGLIR